MKNLLLKAEMRIGMEIRCIILNTMYSFMYLFYPQKHLDTWKTIVENVRDNNAEWDWYYNTFNVNEDARFYYGVRYVKIFKKMYSFVRVL